MACLHFVTKKRESFYYIVVDKSLVCCVTELFWMLWMVNKSFHSKQDIPNNSQKREKTLTTFVYNGMTNSSNHLFFCETRFLHIFVDHSNIYVFL